MDFKTFLVRKMLFGFFVSVACICAVMAILGQLYEPDTRFGYQAFYYPIFYGAIGVLPSIVSWSKNELPLRKALVRKILHLILLEGAILYVLYSGGALRSIGVTISLAAAIAIISLVVYLVLWLNDKRMASLFNAALKTMQNKNEDGNV